MIAQTSLNMKHLEEKVALENSIGIESVLLTQSELHEKAHYISAKMVGASFCPIEGKANPLLVAPAFVRKARHLGATIRTKTKVIEIRKKYFLRGCDSNINFYL